MGSEGDVKKGKAGKGSVKSSLVSEKGKKGKQLQDLRSVYQNRPGPPTILLPLSSGQAEGADSHSHSLPFLGLSLLNINLFSCPKIWKKIWVIFTLNINGYKYLNTPQEKLHFKNYLHS